MAFWTRSFIYDDVPSETYGLFLISEGGSGVLTNVGSGSVNLYTKEVYRRPQVYLYGVQQTPVLTFNLNFASIKPICADMQAVISKWLFGQPVRKRLQICQDDYQSVYFNCLLTQPEFGMYGNFAYSVRCQVICDSPFAWEYPRTIVKKNIKSQITFDINNWSDINDYVRPITTFTLNSTTSFHIRNNTLGKTFSMTGLSANEVIKIDNDLGIISSSIGILRYNNSSGDFFSLAPNLNSISIGDDLKKVEITYQNAKRVSA